MGEHSNKDVIKFADELVTASKMLKLTTVKGRGQKALGQRTRVLLSKIKRNITPIKKNILENEHECR